MSNKEVLENKERKKCSLLGMFQPSCNLPLNNSKWEKQGFAMGFDDIGDGQLKGKERVWRGMEVLW